MNKKTNNKIKNFLMVTLSLFCAVILLVVSVNYTVDPANLFHPDRDVLDAHQAIEILLSGQNVDHMDNYNERLVKRYMIYQFPAAETIVLGSSRAALISKDMIGTGSDSFLNLSITGASVYDLVGLYGVLYQEGKLPQKIIFSLDMWWLNDNYSSGRFDSVLTDGYNAYVTKRLGYTEAPDPYVSPQYADADYAEQQVIAPWQGGADAVSELFRVSYFQSALQTQFNDTKMIVPTTEYLTESGVLRTDGSYGYPRPFRDADAVTISQRAQEWLPANVLGCEDYAMSGDKTKALFEDFVNSLVEDGVEVQFVLTPVNPIVYRHLQNNARYARALQAENWFLQVAETHHLAVSGSFDPDKVGAVLTDFYDAPHYKMEGVAALVGQLGEKQKEEANA